MQVETLSNVLQVNSGLSCGVNFYYLSEVRLELIGYAPKISIYDILRFRGPVEERAVGTGDFLREVLFRELDLLFLISNSRFIADVF